MYIPQCLFPSPRHDEGTVEAIQDEDDEEDSEESFLQTGRKDTVDPQRKYEKLMKSYITKHILSSRVLNRAL